MMDVSRLFVDTNVLIYWTDPVSPWHQVASNILQQKRTAEVELVISSQVLREYLAAATRSAMKNGGNPIEDILQNLHRFRSEFTVVMDGPLVLNHLEILVRSVSVGGKQIHDANIVATMQVHGIQHLLTHNVSDFSRFSHLIRIIPLQAID